jgi:hypothetical protein
MSQLIKPHLKHTKEEKESAVLGKKIIDSSEEALVVYKNKVWTIKDLLEFLAEKVKLLEKNQCSPAAGCLFKYHDYTEQHVEKVKKLKR